MDRELEEQIDEIIQKTTKDLKLKILKIVLKNQNKILKEQARELKGGSITTRKSSCKESLTKKSAVSKKDSDSDAYYSS